MPCFPVPMLWPASEVPPIAEEDVHVWLLTTEPPADRRNYLASYLTVDERERAARFRFERDRTRFASVRGALRELLGRYLERPPGALRFEYSEYGKPSLANAAGWRFNLAHAHEWAMIAVARDREVGIDVERLRPELEVEAVAGQFFSAVEVDALMSLPLEQRRDAFFAGWSRKEAYIKAVGLGLSLPLDSFDVSLEPGTTSALLATRLRAGGEQRWLLGELHAPVGYSAALAVEVADRGREALN